MKYRNANQVPSQKDIISEKAIDSALEKLAALFRCVHHSIRQIAAKPTLGIWIQATDARQEKAAPQKGKHLQGNGHCAWQAFANTRILLRIKVFYT